MKIEIIEGLNEIALNNIILSYYYLLLLHKYNNSMWIMSVYLTEWFYKSVKRYYILLPLSCQNCHSLRLQNYVRLTLISC